MVKASAQITLNYVVDVQATYRYYLLQGSTLSAPSKPTAYPPPSTWDDSEPSYTSGSTNSLYFVDCTVFSDDTFQYSEVSLSTSYEAAKEAFNKATTAQNAANELQSKLDISLDVIVGTQTAVTGSWTGVAKFLSLTDGQQIVYWLPYAGSGNATLNLTLSDGSTTGAKNCYYGGTTRITTHYPAGSTIRLTYRESVSIAGSSTKYTGWWADANYSSDTYDRTKYSRAIKCGDAAIVAKNIIVGANGTYHHLNSGEAFDISNPILYASSAIRASATGTNNYITIPFTVTTTQSITLTAYKPVYIQGTLEGTTFTPVSTAPLTQTIPDSDDGYDYILLGQATTTAEMYLLPEHPIFTYYNGSFKSFEQIAAEAAKSAEDAQTSADNAQETADEAKNRINSAELLIDKINACISTLVTDGNGGSLMTQTPDGWTFNMQSVNDAVFAVSSGLDDLQNEVGDTRQTVDLLNSAIADLGVLAAYVQVKTDGDQPCIELGTGNSDFKLLITNTDIRFMEGSSVPAYINNKSLYIKKAVVEEEFVQGDYVWKVRSNGNLGLSWKGAST